MAANQRQLRENSCLPTAGWTRWERAMVPERNARDNNLVPRGPHQVGFMCSSIRSAFLNQARHCGIYEWRAKGTLPSQPDRVVYVGSTCRSKSGALRSRIFEYCRDGSHKENLINDALDKGYELWVRVKIVGGRNPSKKDAEDMENALLAKYDYGWNIRNNGQIRNILAASRLLRENSDLPTLTDQGWSDWEKAMAPASGVGLQPRGLNQVGFICSSIITAFPFQTQFCGIYEWGAKGTKPHQPNYVVYLGSTCRDKTRSLRERILQFCTKGCHKRVLINNALRRGYELWVRVKIFEGSHPTREDAEDMKNTLLARYDYAWNIRNNGQIRNILP